jgi:hypothetical protein
MKKAVLKNLAIGLAVIAVVWAMIDYTDTPKEFHEGLAAVEKDGKWGYVDTLGTLVVPFQYDSVGHFSGGVSVVRISHKIGTIDKTGKTIIAVQYDSIGNFVDSMAIVVNDGKHGFVDMTGKEVIPLLYDNAEPFADGWAQVILNSDTLKIDKKGDKPKFTIVRMRGFNFMEIGNVQLEGTAEGKKVFSEKGINKWFEPRIKYVDGRFYGSISMDWNENFILGNDAYYVINVKVNDKKYEMKIQTGMQFNYKLQNGKVVILFDEAYCLPEKD